MPSSTSPPPAIDPTRARALARGLLPELLDAAALGMALCVSASAARRMVRSGRLAVAYSRIGRRLIVRREELLRAVAAAETLPLPPRPRSWLGTRM